MVKEFFVPMSDEYRKYWGDTLSPGYVHFFMFGLLVAKVVRVEKGGLWMTMEPNKYYTEKVHEVNKELFKGFFDDEAVPEIQARLKKAVSAVPELPSPPPKEEKKRRGRPPKDKAEASTVATAPPPATPPVSDELEIPVMTL